MEGINRIYWRAAPERIAHASEAVEFEMWNSNQSREEPVQPNENDGVGSAGR
jgi:hypothetical protein